MKKRTWQDLLHALSKWIESLPLEEALRRRGRALEDYEAQLNKPKTEQELLQKE